MATESNCKQQSKSDFIFLYDTTLRDGAQRKGISLSLADKLKITRLLDGFGIPYIEGGWPGSNPKDMEYFKCMHEAPPKAAKIAAFGSTRRVGVRAEDDANLQALLAAQTPVVTIVGKTWTLHVEQVLKTELDQNLKMIADSVRFLKSKGKEVIYDSEHFFDGFDNDPDYALRCLEAASEAGADWLILCDTNGRSLPQKIREAVSIVKAKINTKLGIHAHNDIELAVANSLSAVEAGVTQIQGTINGYGERCGNANLITLIPTLQLRMNKLCVPESSVQKLTELSRAVSEIANLNPDPFAPYVGSAAFAHKGGIHVAAVEKVAHSYEHIDPTLVGNNRQIVVSELSGRGNIRMVAAELGVSLNGGEQSILSRIKDMELDGFQFENAEGTVELMMRRNTPGYTPPFKLIDFTVAVSNRAGSAMSAEAVVKLWVNKKTAGSGIESGEELVHTASDGRGPVHAIDLALRKALLPYYPELANVRLSDYKVRILNPHHATEATTRVFIEATCGDESWSTVGCSPNIIEASYLALADSLELYLLKRPILESDQLTAPGNNTNKCEVVA